MSQSERGLIVRAQDPTKFALIHFPQTGQQFRAQHFWVASSIADGSGYLRLKHVELVRRVASNPFGIAHQDSWFKTLRAQYIRVTERGLEPVRM
jgi:hypothetical protein